MSSAAPTKLTTRLAKVLSVVACPNCGRDHLPLETQHLVCSCGSSYPLRGEVPDFSGDEVASVEGVQFQWAKRRAGTFEAETLYGKTVAEEEGQFYPMSSIGRPCVRGRPSRAAAARAARNPLQTLRSSRPQIPDPSILRPK